MTTTNLKASGMEFKFTHDYLSDLENYPVEDKKKLDNVMDYVRKYTEKMSNDWLNGNWYSSSIVTIPRKPLPEINFIMDSPYKKLFDILGFKVENVREVLAEEAWKTVVPLTLYNRTMEEDWPNIDSVILGSLICPCGKTETFWNCVGEGRTKDSYEMLYKNGNISIEHLRNDGFPEEFVKECEIKYREAEKDLGEKKCPKQWLKNMIRSII